MAKTNASPLAQLDETLDLYFGKKAPALPTNVKEIIVKVAPWLAVVLVILFLLGLPALLAVFGIGAMFAPVGMMGGVNYGATYIISLVLMIVTVVLEALAIPGLFKRTKAGWNFLFYSTLVGIISNVLSLNISGIILGVLIPLYFLYQVKSYYK